MTTDLRRVPEADRRIAAAKARIAQLGGALHVLNCDPLPPVFLIARWCLTKELPDIAAVERWLAHVERRA